MDTSHGNKTSWPHRPDPNPPIIRKVPADSVPYGESVSRNGSTVVAAYDPQTERLVCIAPTAAEARRKYRDIKFEENRMDKPEAGRGGSNVESEV